MRDLDSEKFIQIILISSFVNVCILWIMMKLLIMIPDETNKSTEILHNTETYIENSAFTIVATDDVIIYDDFIEQRDAAMEVIFQEALVGKYKVTNSIEFNFGLNGLYSGFFDNANQSVSGYRYEVVVLNDIPYVNIYNNEETAMVSYELILSKKNKVILFYPNTNLEIHLK